AESATASILFGMTFPSCWWTKLSPSLPKPRFETAAQRAVARLCPTTTHPVNRPTPGFASPRCSTTPGWLQPKLQQRVNTNNEFLARIYSDVDLRHANCMQRRRHLLSLMVRRVRVGGERP